MSKQIFEKFDSLSTSHLNILKLLKNTIWYGFLNSIYSLSLFLIVPAMTSYLSPYDYGLYSLYVLILALIAPLIGCGLSQAVMRAYTERTDPSAFARYISTSVCVLTSLFGLSLLLLFLTHTFMGHVLPLPFSILAASATIAYSLEFETLLLGLFQMEKKPLLFGLWRIMRTLSFMILTLIGLRAYAFFETIVLVELGVSVCSLLACIFWMQQQKLLKFDFEWRIVQEALKYGFPIIFYTLSILIYSTFNRLFLNYYKGPEAVGAFFVGYQIGMAMSLIVQSVSQALMPFAFDWMRATNLMPSPTYERIKQWIIFLFLLCGILMTLAFYGLFDFFIAPSFEKAKTVFPFVIGAFTLNGLYRLDSFYMFYAKNTRALALITLASCAVSFLLNGFLIPRFGIDGASLSLFLSYAATVVFTKLVLSHLRRKEGVI